ncbi:hypothetical protein SAMN06272771_4228 [Streptomyces sp. Ag82_O1-12]|uniref:hypothetical protein n=1 Tax=unclassified Streptomyces TaxID=2593676 RepID=UPI000BCCBE3E|nr:MULTISPECIES: hypothetical protein [unclassified Streptomyces]SMQ17797.1 hypothetical protein SAMN06272771_4228 [Streptomyces sp. Ag82_O1-12]SOD46835.1 hypothetical protein SAMN06272727_4228 [Streptomyces sp. Ag82_G6-1]
MKIKRLTATTAVITAAAILSTGLGQAAMAADRGTTAGSVTVAAQESMTAAEELETADGQKLLAMLKVIEEIPDSVEQQGEAAVKAYLDKNLRGDKPSLVAFGWWQKAKCVGSITAAIAGGAVPIAKILKLKAFIKKAGSVKEAAYLLIRISKGEEKISELGATLGGLASVVLGIDGIKKNCK